MKIVPLMFGCVLSTCALLACSPKPGQAPAEGADAASSAAAPTSAVTDGIPAGDYKLDKSHASLVFKVSHLGFSHYTAEFKSFDANMTLDPAKPETSSLTATVDVASLDLPTPPKGFTDTLLGTTWLDAAKFPQIAFRSTRVERTGTDTAKIYGDLTLKGVTKPVVLEVRFNGGYAGLATYDPNARVGFSATGQIKRSDFGITYGIPEPGSTMGVSDAVDIAIETEFTGPAMAPVKPAA